MNDQNQQPDQTDVVTIKKSELPAYCPTESMDLYGSHPRVYIPLEENKQSNCPYCGTRFVLVEG